MNLTTVEFCVLLKKKPKKAKEKFETDKSKEEKKAKQDKIIKKNETNIEPKLLVENHEKGQKEVQKIESGNRLMTIDVAKVDTTVAEKMRPGQKYILHVNNEK
ncbi:unnamed protein product [Onchocerca flexuosa]|uniref:tRNA-binding domain-containing protein n=1 Tax=Onchocerca flexuosa TaxID=387005 RepID=A0A183I6V4_9BILA|nr:unnamed protein product [Onchocerca flexuosa]